MAFWHRNRFEAPPENSAEEISARLAELKQRKETLMTHAGTDAWVPEDANLLTKLNEQIAELEKGLPEKEAA
jgi:hypothetical protein